MKTIHDFKTIAKQYALHKQKYTELKEGQQKPSSLRVCPSSGKLRPSECLGLKSLITPATIHRIPNLRLKPIKSQRTPIKVYKTPLENPEYPPFIMNVMWKEELGISDSFDIIGSGSKSKNKALVRKDGSSSSSTGQPVGLGVGLPPLPKKASVDLVSSLIPLLLFSYTYFSTYSVSDLLTILDNMGMNPVWLREMLGMSWSYPCYDITPFDITPFFRNESCNDVASELQQVSSNEQNYQFLRLLSLVAGSVGVGVIVLWLASNGCK